MGHLLPVGCQIRDGCRRRRMGGPSLCPARLRAPGNCLPKCSRARSYASCVVCGPVCQPSLKAPPRSGSIGPARGSPFCQTVRSWGRHSPALDMPMHSCPPSHAWAHVRASARTPPFAPRIHRPPRPRDHQLHDALTAMWYHWCDLASFTCMVTLSKHVLRSPTLEPCSLLMRPTVLSSRPSVSSPSSLFRPRPGLTSSCRIR